MGCDGGTIPRRDELVRMKKKPEKKDKDAERQFRWLHCSLTQQRLQVPIVMCGLGRLYSKQNIIEQLLDKEKMPDSSKHIKTLKDIKNLNLTPNPSFKDDDKAEGSLDARNAPFICKLIGLEMSGKFRFIALWTCGCVYSERAFKETKTSTCVLCQTPFTEDDIVILNGTEEETELMQTRMEIRNNKRKSLKKTANAKKVEETIVSASELPSTSSAQPEPSTSSKEEKELTSTDEKTDQDVKQDIGKMSKLLSTGKRPGLGRSLEDPDIKKLKTDYSVANDPKATDVYKSLFTTHKSEQQQTRAHWVTYNPFYN